MMTILNKNYRVNKTQLKKFGLSVLASVLSIGIFISVFWSAVFSL